MTSSPLMSRLKWILAVSAGGLAAVALLLESRMRETVTTGQTGSKNREIVSARSKTDIRILPVSTSPPQPGATRRRVPNRPATASASDDSSVGLSTQSIDPYISEDLRGIEPGVDVEAAFAAAEQEFGVPAALLKALAYAETQMEHGDGSAKPGGGRGIMNLRNTVAGGLTEAAALLHLDKAALVRDPAQNIRGAAALLRKYHDDAVGAGADKRPWYIALSYYGAHSPEEAVRLGDQIRNLLHEGFVHTTAAGAAIKLDPGQEYLLGE